MKSRIAVSLCLTSLGFLHSWYTYAEEPAPAIAQTQSSSSTTASVSTPAAPTSGSLLPAEESNTPRPRTSSSSKEEDPRVIPESIRTRIGSDYKSSEPIVEKPSRSGLFPLAYREHTSEQQTTVVFPFYYDRKKFDFKRDLIEQQSWYGLYFRQRSQKVDIDIAFPFWVHWRNEQTQTHIVPPVLWRDAPNGGWHRWVAPLFFASSKPDGGYLHIPPLLTFSYHNAKRAFSLIGGIGFYDRTDRNVDWGAVPFVFGGHNDDKLTNYLLIPPLLTYHSENRDTSTQTTLIGPFYSRTTPVRTVVDVFPLFFHNHGDDQHSTTLLPLFHYSRDKDKSLLVTPLFLHAKDQESSTTVTMLYSQYRGRTQLDVAGPILPIFMRYEDPDRYKTAYMLAPFFYSSNSPRSSVFVTPLGGQWNDYGVSTTTWIFPTFEYTATAQGWNFNMHPLFYFGSKGEQYHSVFAPFWWDFKNGQKRSTVFFPLFWNFQNQNDMTLVAANSIYLERHTSAGVHWDYHFAPAFHVGGEPNGFSFDILFGLLGYKNVGTYHQLKLFWAPIDLTENPNEQTRQAQPTQKRRKRKRMQPQASIAP